MKGLLAAVVLLASCGEERESTAELLTRALRLAAAGDATSWDLCLHLEAGQGRGQCKVEAAQTQPDPGAACTSIARDHWRGECWFQLAEEAADEGRWSDAIDACGTATPYVDACARHLWWISRSADTGRDEALYTRLVATFPSARPKIDAVDGDLARIASELGRGSDPKRDRALSAFNERWERALERDPSALDTLCSGQEALARGRATEGDPERIAALERLRAERCPPKR